MTAPINSVRTRVIDTGSGYVAQMSTDGLMWFDLPDMRQLRMSEPDLHSIKYHATRMAMAAQALPSSGRVVWSSDAGQ